MLEHLISIDLVPWSQLIEKGGAVHDEKGMLNALTSSEQEGGGRF